MSWVYIYIDEEIGQLEGELVCPMPDQNLHSFDGTLTFRSLPKLKGGKEVETKLKDIKDNGVQLTIEHLVLQSTVLKQTEWALGVCVYSGMESKINQNNPAVRHKFTTLDQMVCG